jgi:hypothetical protein
MFISFVLPTFLSLVALGLLFAFCSFCEYVYLFSDLIIFSTAVSPLTSILNVYDWSEVGSHLRVSSPLIYDVKQPCPSCWIFSHKRRPERQKYSHFDLWRCNCPSLLQPQNTWATECLFLSFCHIRIPSRGSILNSAVRISSWKRLVQTSVFIPLRWIAKSKPWIHFLAFVAYVQLTWLLGAVTVCSSIWKHCVEGDEFSKIRICFVLL